MVEIYSKLRKWGEQYVFPVPKYLVTYGILWPGMVYRLVVELVPGETRRSGDDRGEVDQSA